MNDSRVTLDDWQPALVILHHRKNTNNMANTDAITNTDTVISIRNIAGFNKIKFDETLMMSR